MVAFVPGDIEDKILTASLSFVQQSSRFSSGCEGLGEFLRRSDLARLLMRPVERHSVHCLLLNLAWAGITRLGSRRHSPLRLPRRSDSPRLIRDLCGLHRENADACHPATPPL